MLSTRKTLKYSLKSKGQKKIYQANMNYKKVGVILSIKDKVNFKTILPERKESFIMIKESIQEHRPGHSKRVGTE